MPWLSMVRVGWAPLVVLACTTGGDSADDATPGTDAQLTSEDSGPAPGSTGETGLESDTGASNDDGADDAVDDSSDGGPQPILCDPAGATDASALAVVEASSEFSPEDHAYLAIDGDESTSWFAAAADPSGAPTSFRFTLPQDECLAELMFVGNGAQADLTLRDGYGFESMTVQILDATEQVIVEEVHTLAGSPDPTITIALDGVLGREIVLLFAGHENPDRAGFSELYVLAAPR
jgi:hypothetical protein